MWCHPFPLTLIFFKMVETTNQRCSPYRYGSIPIFIPFLGGYSHPSIPAIWMWTEGVLLVLTHCHMFHHFHNVGPPSDVCWFINPINSSYLRTINQFVKLELLAPTERDFVAGGPTFSRRFTHDRHCHLHMAPSTASRRRPMIASAAPCSASRRCWPRWRRRRRRRRRRWGTSRSSWSRLLGAWEKVGETWWDKNLQDI